MKTIKGLTVFQCDFCKRKFFVAGGCANHEKICKKNPLNQHPCFNCEHLNREDDYIFEHDPSYDHREIPRLTFRCGKTGQYMYSHKAAVRKHYATMEESHIEMPLQCDSFDECFGVETQGIPMFFESKKEE